ncbi:MAG: hypothetical protein HIU84_06875 [Acidobacteria bacterium]|nr:hypothetical protein [Acidobacteriota bacterium]
MNERGDVNAPSARGFSSLVDTGETLSATVRVRSHGGAVTEWIRSSLGCSTINDD